MIDRDGVVGATVVLTTLVTSEQSTFSSRSQLSSKYGLLFVLLSPEGKKKKEKIINIDKKNKLMQLKYLIGTTKGKN